ncbi:unnamed protein product [Thelazia callipaeda]|uniref:FAD_binding_2 domain-containing protein n=1 Tax=Thelazia callipaeda TaxID=103827 RepID=A0A0N5D0L8_THECL|nr:unnamed protein product [Thelazia callipaeda]
MNRISARESFAFLMKFATNLLLAMVTEFAVGVKYDSFEPNTTNHKSTRNLQVPDFTEPVIIVGGGLAGLSATLEAIHEGAKVVLIEGEKDLGGNSQKASSGIAACNTEAQRMRQIADSPDLFYSDTMSAGDHENDHILVQQLVHKSPTAVQFLIDNGVDLSDVNLCGGHSVKRVHWIPQSKEGKPVAVGFSIIQALKKELYLHQKAHPEKVNFCIS